MKLVLAGTLHIPIAKALDTKNLDQHIIKAVNPPSRISSKTPPYHLAFATPSIAFFPCIPVSHHSLLFAANFSLIKDAIASSLFLTQRNLWQ